MTLSLDGSPGEARGRKGAEFEGLRDLVLIRHGRYADPAESGYRFIGRCDPPLDAVGLAQASGLQTELAHLQHPVVVSSPLRRALQTAQLAFPRLDIETNDLALEINFGELEGMDFAEALAKYPAAMQRYPDLDFSGVGGENRPSLIARADRLLGYLRQLPGTRPLVLVSHAYFLDAFCAVIDGEPQRPYSRAFQHCIPVMMQIRI